MIPIRVEPLSDHPVLQATVQHWFEQEWPSHYHSAAIAAADVSAYSRAQGLPRGFVAFRGSRPCGFAALKSEPFPTHPQLGPWAGAAYVRPELRRQGIGQTLFVALEAAARKLGFARLYCATATSASLLRRGGWQLLDQVVHEGENIGVYEKAL
jgi:GNAT superfamily N-acetyltransferase